jgi:malate synthase
MEEIILSEEARAFLDSLHRNFNAQRLKLLQERSERQKELDSGISLKFLEETAKIREDPSWRVVSPPSDLKVRTVEITGPVERKMMINALNSGADLFMADFEDALSPTWENVIEGQKNLIDAIRRTISFRSPEGKEYALQENTATLAVRPRGWHLPEKHYKVDGEEMSGSLFDFGLFLFHNGRELINTGTGPYLYLPKMESYREATLWKEVFHYAEDVLLLPRGSIKVTVLIETILAAFEMEEILFELKEYIVGLNAGRWDYIFSIIKKFASDKKFLFPDRQFITMTSPFMKAYTSLLIDTCLRRGAQPIGGMAAFIPSRKDPELNARALQKVREDKWREAEEGFIGTWVAHPDLVNVAREALLSKKADPKRVSEGLLDFHIEGKVTPEGVAQNVDVALLYFESWLSGIGAAAIHNLMEDAATAEISRAQLWQWVHHGAVELDTVLKEIDKRGTERAKKLLRHLVASPRFIEFFTLEAYKQL